MLLSSLSLTLVDFVHNDIGLSSSLILKNVCNAGGYITFELGAYGCMSTSLCLFSSNTLTNGHIDSEENLN